MDSPPPWSFAARAAYFGDRICPFCDHRNPAGAKFCNDCGSPLHLKPCSQCSAVNHQAATNCYKCGAQCPASFTTPQATPALPAADPTAACATEDVGAATVTQPLFAVRGLRVGWSLAAIATILIAGAYGVYRINATAEVTGVASQPIVAVEHKAPTAASAVPMAVESTPVKPETISDLQAPGSTTVPETPKRAGARHRPPLVSATKHASAHRRPVPNLHASEGASAPVAQTLAAAPVDAVGETHKAHRPDPRRAMHVSLASCGGDLIARVVCDQRVRRRLCERHWGEAQECASGVPDDHGQ